MRTPTCSSDWPSGSTTSAVAALLAETDDSHELADDMNASGFAVIGTPDGVADQISG